MLKLVLSPDPILNTVSEPWIFDQDCSPDQLEQEMIKLMVASRGIGLAANQVGIAKRFFAIQLQDGSPPFVMFNPRVIEASEELQDGEEGCLSFPELWLTVKRPKTILSEYFDKSGICHKIQLTGLDARCFLHELEHLDGVCFTEKVSPLKLSLAKKKQRKRNGRAKR